VVEKCEVVNCLSLSKVYKNKKSGMFLCNKHKQQFNKLGRIQERTIHDPNEIIDCIKYSEVILYNVKGIEIARALIDTEDIEIVSKCKWYLNSNGYAYTNNEKLSLHRFILGNPKNKQVDHINGNRLDNRKINLRLCSNQENSRNKKLIPSKTGVRGVRPAKQFNRFIAEIYVNGKNIYLGTFDSIEEAKEARVRAEILYFKDLLSPFCRI
jgi:hypothetical protein